MPNWADFSMRIRGTKDNCEKFKDILFHENDKLYFHRTFPYDKYTEGAIYSDYFMEFCGECAWSFICSMGESQTYSDGTHSSTVCEISKLLNLSVEIYTTETGWHFSEHYFYKNGDELIADCVDYQELWWDEDEHPTLEDFNAAMGTNFTLEDFHGNDYVVVGGFGEWEWAS